MRRAAFVLPLLVVLAAFVVRADETGSPSTTTLAAAPGAADPPAVQETVVHGTPPDLAGRWFMLATLEIQEGNKSSLSSFWEFTQRDGKLELTHLFRALPPAQQAAMQKASEESQAWSPTPVDLAAIRDGWETLKPEDAKTKLVKNDISGKDGFDQTLTAEPRTNDAMFVIRQRVDMHPSAAPVVRYAFVYAATAATEDGYTGNFDGATIAVAPFPIPIPVKGSFHMYRLDAPQPAGLLARIAGFFRGCGRSR